ncbi:MAG: GNAT family N-acetyltransferase [Crocinitomicaceae bacterium]|nr:GNAT family N-acetyltransferase [Crocinitomicaceae bacterium]
MNIETRTPKSQDEWDLYYNLRFRILREPLNQPLGSERNEDDITGEHFALYDDGVLMAIARLDQTEVGISQVRFVAVESGCQGKGYGRMIMEATEEKSKADGNTKMILHARDYAVDFYLRLDYVIIEKSYKLFDVLQHFLMEKNY